MKMCCKSLREYLKFSWLYMLLVFIVSLVMLALLQLKITLAYNLLGALAVAITFVAGWNAAKNRFNLKQAFIIGTLCFIGNLWLIPFSIMFYLSNRQIPQNYFLINLVVVSLISGLLTLLIYIAFALLGFLISSKIYLKK